MQGPAWISLLRRIPSAQHDCLVLMTTSMAQIVLQRLIRLENDFLVGLGLLAGSTEQGKVVVIPYDQLTYLSFNKRLTDAEIETVLGQPGVAVKVGESQAQPASAPASAPAVAEEKPGHESNGPSLLASKTAAADTPSPAKSAGQPAAKPHPKASMPSKSILLARLRQRLADDAAKQPKP